MGAEEAHESDQKRSAALRVSRRYLRPRGTALGGSGRASRAATRPNALSAVRGEGKRPWDGFCT